MDKLKEKNIWILWKLINGKNGKPTKMPIAFNGNSTGTNNEYSNTWVTYNKAIENVDLQNASGIGFVIPKNYFFLDIDHNDIKSPLVKEMLNRFDTYAEYSQSHNGIHIYGIVDESKLPIDDIKNKKFYMKNSNLNLELYIGGLTNRFACFTGNTIKDINLKDCTDSIIKTLNNEMLKDSKSADEIVSLLKTQSNANKFINLFEKGDINGYGSQSEADLALCSMIAFRTGNDINLIDKVFRKSKLYRDKWERDDYRIDTINKAIKLLNGNFHKSVLAHPSFIKFKQNGTPYVSVPLLANFIRKNLTYKLVRDNAKQSLQFYLYEDGVYKLYSEDMLIGIVKKYIADYDEELLSISDVKASISHILTDLNYIKQEDLNDNENIINFKNGILNLTDMKLYPHDKSILSTIQIPCDWLEKETDTKIFDKYINTLSNNNEDVKELLLQYMGAILSNVKGYKLKAFMLLIGESNSGKSQFKSLIEKLLGKGNYMSIDLSELTERFATSSLYGKRLAGSSDMGYLTVSDTKILKQLTGGDSIMAEFKGENHFEYVFNGLLLMCANKKPKFGANQNDNATYERIIIIECPNVIPKDKQDKDLLNKMYAEKEGIVYKAITSFKKAFDNSYTLSIPKIVTDAKSEYKKENDTIILFIEECLTIDTDGKLPERTTTEIYQAYLNYCRANNNGFSKSRKELKDEIAKYFNILPNNLIVHRTFGNFYQNITLNNTNSKDYY